MRIAMISPPHNPIPGNENIIWAPGLVISSLTEELVRRNHDVTLFAPADSHTSAKLESAGLNSIMHDYPKVRDEDRLKFEKLYVQYELMLINSVLEQANEGKFDLIHSHDYRRLMYFSKTTRIPIIYTYHGTPNTDIVEKIDKMRFEKFAPNSHFVAASQFQIDTGQQTINFIGKVNHGLDINQFKFCENPKTKKFLFAGRLIEIKGISMVLEAIKRAGANLIIAGKPGDTDEDKKFFQDNIKPILSEKWIDYRGYVPYQKMPEVYRDACAMFMTTTIGEAFGFVTIEAQAVGVPVIGFNIGATSELVIDGKTGYIIEPNDITGLVASIKKIQSMPDNEYRAMRKRCRQHVERNFTIEKMVDGYEEIYQKIVKK